MGLLKTVELEVSRDGILRTLADQFTKKTTFIGELLQNSRRAGATQIDITVKTDGDAVCFTLKDNGEGGMDFASLFTLGKTGWNEDTVSSDNPFGVGFASVLHASKRVSIQSTNGGCDFSVDDALSCKPIAISEPVRECGSSFTLQLNSDFCREGDIYLQNAVTNFVVGFPVPVSLNGVFLPRPYATNSGLDFVRAELGDVAIVDLERTTVNAHDIPDSIYPNIVFVQGLPVRIQIASQWQEGGGRTIVHIDHPDFRPRMPDRAYFCDDADLKPVLKDGIVAVYRKALLAKLGEFSDPAEFVDTYRDACIRSKNLDLLNELPVTASMLSLADSYYTPERENNTYRSVSHALDMERPYFLDDEFDSGNDWDGIVLSAAWQYAVRQNIPLIYTSLDKEHLALKKAICPSKLKAVVTTVNAKPPADFLVFGHVEVEIVICDSVGLSFVDVDDAEVLPPITIIDEVVYANNIIYVPSDCTDDGLRILETASNYQDENYSMDETMLDDDTNQFIAIVHALRGGTAKDYLRTILKDAEYYSAGLTGLGDVVVAIGDNGRLVVK